MKKHLLLVVIGLIISCNTSKKSSSVLKEDEIYITRRYIGDFVGYENTDPQSFGGPHLIWIRTTQDSIQSKISAYSKRCEFSVGDKIYLRRTYCPSGVFGYWFYQVENDSSIYYRISSFEDDERVLVQNWF